MGGYALRFTRERDPVIRAILPDEIPSGMVRERWDAEGPEHSRRRQKPQETLFGCPTEEDALRVMLAIEPLPREVVVRVPR